MVTLHDAQIDDDEDAQIKSTDLIPNSNPNPYFPTQSDPMPMKSTPGVEPMVAESAENPGLNPVQLDSRHAVKIVTLVSGVVEKIVSGKVEQLGSEEVSSDSITESDHNNNILSECLVREKISEGDEYMEEVKKSFSADQSDATMEEVVTPSPIGIVAHSNGNTSKKSSKKKNKCYSVWLKPTSRKGKKKAKNFNSNLNHSNGGSHTAPKMENSVLLTPFPRLLYKSEDSPGANIVLSKVHKAEKVELSEDRLSAGSSKGYRMVRTTRGVIEGAWFFEIKVVNLGETGHSRLGWSTEKGDLEAPVGYDGFSYGYRDVDGSKVHKALREKYGDESYKEGDVIGFYINLPEGASFAPKRPKLAVYKGQKYVCASDTKEEPPKCVPGSEISFFKNGICQGVAFKDLCGGCYYPAASMYTLPNQPNCVVKFNFGPDFECFPTDFGSRPVPKPMIEAPYHGSDNPTENGVLDESKQ